MIAVIGDGINLEFYPMVKELCFDLKVNRNKTITNRGSHIRCMESNSTTCAAIIKKYCPTANIGSIQVHSNDELGCCDSVDLIVALEWCLNSNVDVVQIAVNGFNSSQIDEIRNVISKLFARGCLVISHTTDSEDLCIQMCIEDLIIVRANKKWNDNTIINTSVGNEVLAPAQHDILNNYGKMITTKLLSVNAASVVVANILSKLHTAILNDEYNDRQSYNIEICKEMGIEFTPLKQRILLKDLSILENEYHIITISGSDMCRVELSLKISKMLSKHGDRCRVFTDEIDSMHNGLEKVPENMSIGLYTLFSIKAMNLKRAIIISNNPGIAKASKYNIIVDPKRQRNHYYKSVIYMPCSFDHINVKNAVDYMNGKNKT